MAGLRWPSKPSEFYGLSRVVARASFALAARTYEHVNLRPILSICP
jgi:hypothetical protein